VIGERGKGNLGSRRARPRASLVWVLTGLVLAVFGSLLAPAFGGSVGASVSLGTAYVSAHCNSVGSPTPSALLVQEPQSGKALRPGGTMGYQMEVEIANWANQTGPVNLTFPTIYFDFPLTTGHNFTITYPAGNITITSGGWTAQTWLSRSAVVPGGLNFSANKTARMDSMKIAIMSSGNYGTVLAKFRWRWTELEPNGTATFLGRWTVPTTRSHFPTSVPSEFYPAAYVRLLSTSGSPATAGTNYTMTVTSPFMPGEWLLMELEYPSGHVVQAYNQTWPAGSSVYGAQILLLTWGHVLLPGTYLVHLHDECGALLYSRVVTTHFPSTANVTLLIPKHCGGVDFAGTRYANNTTISVTPSVTPYDVKASTCRGMTFDGFNLTGGLHQTSLKRVLVTCNGTLQIRYT
jgi:hypothetical protein